MGNWTLFSNHGHVLVCLARDSEARLRDVAASVGITERAVQKIVRDLQDGGMVSVTKHGRRNCYRIHTEQCLRHDLEANCTIGDLVKLVNKLPKPHQSIAEAESMPVSKSMSIAPNPVKRKLEQPAPGKVETSKVETSKVETGKVETGKVETGKIKSSKSKLSSTTERQQGSLF